MTSIWQKEIIPHKAPPFWCISNIVIPAFFINVFMVCFLSFHFYTLTKNGFLVDYFWTFYFYLFFWLLCVTCIILFPWLGIERGPTAVKALDCLRIPGTF